MKKETVIILSLFCSYFFFVLVSSYFILYFNQLDYSDAENTESFISNSEKLKIDSLSGESEALFPDTVFLDEIDVKIENLESLLNLINFPSLEKFEILPYLLDITNNAIIKHRIPTLPANSKPSLFAQKNSFPNCSESGIIITEQQDADLLQINATSIAGKYIEGFDLGEEKFGSTDFGLSWKKFDSGSIINTTNSEFIIAQIGNGQKQAFLHNKFSKKAASRAHSISSKINRLSNNKKSAPLGVYILLLDSVSRASFYENLNSSVSYLNSKLMGKGLVAYDFLLNHAQDSYTVPNMIPFLFGKSLQSHEKSRKGLNIDFEGHAPDFERIQDSSLWKHYERLGFVTLFGYDTTYDYLSMQIGRKIYTDHSVLNFWNAAKKVFGYNDFITSQRCLGNKNSHKYMLDYINEFSSNYKGVNKFVYTHFSTAHEETGTVIQTLDNDLKGFFEDFFRIHHENNEDFALVVASDHGSGGKGIEGWINNKLPLQLLIMNERLIKKVGKNANDLLRTNTLRLVSRFDWYATLKHFAYLPYGNIDPQIYEKIIKSTDSSNAVSLLIDEIPENRTCEDVNIDPSMCLERPFAKISLNSQFALDGIAEIVNKSLNFLNSQQDQRPLCKNILVDKILEISEFRITSDKSGGHRFVHVLISVKNYESVLIKFEFFAAQVSEFNWARRNSGNNRPEHVFYTNGQFGGIFLSIQADYIRRVSENFCSEYEDACICD